MADKQFDTWRKILANPKVIGKEVLISDTDPQPGYYRARLRKGDLFTPVVYWFDQDGVLRCQHGHDQTENIELMNRLWVSGCRHPITVAAWKHWMATGSWGDVDETVADQVTRGSNVEDIPPEVIFADQVASALAGVQRYAKIENPEQAAAAQSLRSRLLELKGQGEKDHKIEKAPHLAASQAVDRKWLPTVKEAQAGADKLRASISAYETALVAEARRKEQEAWEAERQANEDHALPPPEELPPPEPVKEQVKGGYGRAASIRMKRIVGEVTDWKKLHAFYIHNTKVQQLLIDLANQDLKRGADVPGVTVEEVADVR